MGTYLKKFNNEIEYNNYINSHDYIEPNVSLVGTSAVRYNPVIDVGTIVYYNGTELKACRTNLWLDSFGIPVAVIVVPSTHTVDGTYRCVSLKGVNSDGTQSESFGDSLAWGPTGETGLQLFNRIVVWNNVIGSPVSATTSASARLSSNAYYSGSGENYVIDCLNTDSKYQNRQYIPNPYLSDGSVNMGYRNTDEIGGTSGNCFSDFDGKGNTSFLVSLGGEYSAANACNLYSTSGIPAGQWYLPSAGELGYAIVKMKEINKAIEKVGGVAFETHSNVDYWTSTERSATDAIAIDTDAGYVYVSSKTGRLQFARPFCSLPNTLKF